MQIRRWYELGIALLGLSALSIRLHDIIRHFIAQGYTIAQGLSIFFSYFTMLTMILIVVNLFVGALMPRSRWGRFFERPSVQAALLLYLVMLLLVYHTMLAHLWEPQGLNLFADRVLHYIVPCAYIVYWLVYVPKGALCWHHACKWLSYPFIYGIYGLIRGHITRHYPYHFGDVCGLGYACVFRNMTLMLIGFFIIGLCIVALDKFLAKKGSLKK